MPGEQLEQHDAERVDVGCGRERIATDLLGARVLRGERAREFARRRHRVGGVVAEKFRDAEVQQLYRAVAGHENVRRLEVAVHDEIAVCVSHRGARLPKK